MAFLMEWKKRGGAKEEATTTVAPRKVCDTPECINLSYQLLNWRDPSVDPCDDFYRNTCGRYPPGSDPTVTRISDLLSKNQTSASQIIIRKYYQKCEFLKIPENSKTDRSFEDLMSAIRKIGPWPMVDWDESMLDEIRTALKNRGIDTSGDSEFLNDPKFKKIISKILKIEGMDEEVKGNLTERRMDLLILKFIFETTRFLPVDREEWERMDCGKIILQLFPNSVQILTDYQNDPENQKILSEIFEKSRGSLLKFINGSRGIDKGEKIRKLKEMRIRYPEITEETDFEQFTVSPDDSWYTMTSRVLPTPQNPPIFYNSTENTLLISPGLSDSSPGLQNYIKLGYLMSKTMANALGIKKNCSETILGSEGLGAEATRISMAEQPLIPGFQDHPDKLFFYILAANLCSEPAKQVNELFSSMKSFSDTFNCPGGSKMNRNNNCEYL
uniref:Peptidase_M13_N domain-containing protein n=1 Tax=Caenorhabditis tropicalis TaxID=1561998 RepID=A0A1I7UKV5_9PELO